MIHNIIEILEKRGIKKSWFADELGVSHSLISHWISGKRKSYKKHIPKICKILNVSLDEINN